MPKWTYSITINNTTDRPLELISSRVPWGKCEKPFPKIIKPGDIGEFCVYSPAGTPSGIEFYFSMRDKVNKKEEPHYGSFSFSVDIPYWKTANKSKFTCSGILAQNGFQEIPDGAHDFSTTVTIFTSLANAFLPFEEPLKDNLPDNMLTSSYCSLYDWDAVQNLKTVDPAEVSINDFLPDKNIFKRRITAGRTEKVSVPKNLWKEIIDRKYPDDYSKQHFIKDYFTVSVYEIRKNTTVNIAANQSYNRTLEVSNRSTVRRETRQEFQIENTINAGSTGEKFSLSETLRMQYNISRLDEYCEENLKSVQETFTYEAIDQDRSVVLWDLAEILILYRINKNNKIELVGVGDYYAEATQKTYVHGTLQPTEETSENTMEELPCAGSENSFCLDDDESDEMFENEYGAPRRPPRPVTGNVTINRVAYRWMEIRQGTNRGMLFNPGNHRYIFQPNPHNDAWYNNHQARWYSDMAIQFQRAGNAGGWTRDNWSAGPIQNLNVHGINYTAR